MVDRDTLLREREARKKAEQEKLAEKERKKAELAASQAAKEAQKRVPPCQMFKSEIDKYSKFDETVSFIQIIALIYNNFYIYLYFRDYRHMTMMEKKLVKDSPRNFKNYNRHKQKNMKNM